MLAPIISLLFVAHLLLQGLLAVFCMFLFFTVLSGAKPFVPDGVNGLIGIIGAVCALQGRFIRRDWITGKKPNIVRIIAMGWTLCFILYALFALKQPVVAGIAVMSAVYMLIRFAPEPAPEKKAEAAKVEETPPAPPNA